MPDLTSGATNHSSDFKLTKPRRAVNHLQPAVKREDNGVGQPSSFFDVTASSSRENCCAISFFQRAVKSFLAVRYCSMWVKGSRSVFSNT